MDITCYQFDISKIIAESQKRIAEIDETLSTLHTGTLQIEKRNGKTLYMMYVNTNGKRTRKVVNSKIKEATESKNASILKELTSKDYLLAEKKILLHNLIALEKVEENYILPTFNNIVDSMPKNYEELNVYDLLFDFSSGNDYERTKYLSSLLIHTTSFGLKVRSKSEAMIAELLFSNNIKFHYEEVLHLDDTHTFVPDFTIKRQDGKTFYWEHCGMTFDEDYMKRHQRKIKVYQEYEIVPWDNLIVSYDDKHGNIDLKVVQAEISSKLL